MSYNQIFSPKNSQDIITLSFEFGDVLEFGETITGQIVNAYTRAGIDPNPNAIVAGAATISGTKVNQIITGGIPGVSYVLLAVANGSNAHVYSKAGELSIVNQQTIFGT